MPSVSPLSLTPLPLTMPSPLRILHIVGILQRGGIETWLMHILRHLDRTQVQVDFLVQTEQPGAYDAEVEALGCRIWRCPLIRTYLWRYLRQFKAILQEQGPYHIVHSHVHHFSGLTLRLAQQQGVPVRIAHSHNDTSPLSQQVGWARQLYLSTAQRWIDRHATLGLAASREAARDLFGTHWQTDPRWQLLYYGIDLSPFQSMPIDPIAARAALTLPADAFVMGHVGRFEPQKNHRFLIQVAEVVLEQDPRAYLVLIGDGPLRADLEQQVQALSVRDRIRFVGLRSDVPRLMQSAMDVLVLPSFHEGLPLVGLEAQAAGLPLVLSDSITPELDAVPPLIHRLSLNQSAAEWATVILGVRSQTASRSPQQALAILDASPFNITYSARQLEATYRQAVEAIPHFSVSV